MKPYCSSLTVVSISDCSLQRLFRSSIISKYELKLASFVSFLNPTVSCLRLCKFYSLSASSSSFLAMTGPPEPDISFTGFSCAYFYNWFSLVSAILLSSPILLLIPRSSPESLPCGGVYCSALSSLFSAASCAFYNYSCSAIACSCYLASSSLIL